MKLSSAPLNKARIEIIPMIDTMFFLLVFFMIATLSMTDQKGQPVNLPEAESSMDTVLPEQITISITAPGDVFFNKDAITIAEIEPRLKDLSYYGEKPAVVINADAECSHGHVLKVMDSLKKAGIFDMSIATKPKKKSEAVTGST